MTEESKQIVERLRNIARCCDVANIYEVAADHIEKLEKEKANALEAIRLTVEENRHLADGEDCTLRRLTRFLEENQ